MTDPSSLRSMDAGISGTASSRSGDSVPCRRPWFSALELVLISSGFFTIVWYIGPNLNNNGLAPLLTVTLGLFLFYVGYASPVMVHRDDSRERGVGNWRTLFVRTDNLREALRPFLWLTLIGTLIITALTLLLQPEIFARIHWQAFGLKLGLYLINASGQGLLFLSFFMLRLKVLLPSPAESGDGAGRHRLLVSGCCALLFALYHLPNPALMLVTLLIGFAACWIYYATPNLLIAVCSHAFLGTLLHQLLEMHMRIGPFYWQSDLYIFRTLFPPVRDLIGNLF